MKKIAAICIVLLLVSNIHGQNENKADFRLGNGLNIQLNNADYSFNLGGFIQPNYQYDKQEDADAQHRFGIKRGFMSFTGHAKKEKISFLFSMDFTQSTPLMDAWIAYHPWNILTISAGQKQTFTNNREMMFLESNLSMTNRSLLSNTFSRFGREFGLFLEGHFSLGNVGILPQISATSGDGINAFGNSSIDADNGGLKYGARLDICPLGSFTGNNDKIGADLVHETSPKLKIGLAGSYNNGASDAVGEGHGNVIFYDGNGKQQFPDYRKLYVDLMFKYQGFSLLGEYANATAASLGGLYTATGDAALLLPEQISDYFYLGNSYNVQLGYVFRSGWALDVRYTKLLPEFKDKTTSLLQNGEAYDATISKYIVDNRLKIQGGFSYVDYPEQQSGKYMQAEILLQVVF